MYVPVFEMPWKQCLVPLLGSPLIQQAGHIPDAGIGRHLLVVLVLFFFLGQLGLDGWVAGKLLKGRDVL